MLHPFRSSPCEKVTRLSPPLPGMLDPGHLILPPPTGVFFARASELSAHGCVSISVQTMHAFSLLSLAKGSPGSLPHCREYLTPVSRTHPARPGLFFFVTARPAKGSLQFAVCSLQFAVGSLKLGKFAVGSSTGQDDALVPRSRVGMHTVGRDWHCSLPGGARYSAQTANCSAGRGMLPRPHHYRLVCPMTIHVPAAPSPLLEPCRSPSLLRPG
jgi:hypothetical protein